MYFAYCLCSSLSTFNLERRMNSMKIKLRVAKRGNIQTEDDMTAAFSLEWHYMLQLEYDNVHAFVVILGDVHFCGFII